MSFPRLMTLQTDLSSPLGGRSNTPVVRIGERRRGPFHGRQVVSNGHGARLGDGSGIAVGGYRALLKRGRVAELLERGGQMDGGERGYHPRHVHMVIRRGALVVRHQSVGVWMVVGGQHALQMRRISPLELELGRGVH